MATADDEVDATMENKSPSTTQRETKTLSRGLLTHSRSLLSTLLSPSQPLQCSILVAQNHSISFVLNLQENLWCDSFPYSQEKKTWMIKYFPYTSITAESTRSKLQHRLHEFGAIKLRTFPTYQKRPRTTAADAGGWRFFPPYVYHRCRATLKPKSAAILDHNH